MGTKKILMPCKFTSYDQKALDFVADMIKNSKDVRITLFHAYTPLPDIEMDSNAVLGRLKDTMKSLRQELRGQESALREAAQALSEKGFPENQINFIFKPKTKDVAEEIIDEALEGNCELIILTRRSGKIARLFSRSVSGKLISSINGIAVCIVS